MKYIRTKDGRIIPTDIATYELTQDICCAGYFRTLRKGSCVTIGKEWTNLYGRWVDIIDEKGTHYSIRPREVEEVTKELPQTDTIEELCDEFIVLGIFENQIGCCCDTFDEAKELKDYVELPQEQIIYGAIWTDKGLIYVAKLNEKGNWELI